MEINQSIMFSSSSSHGDNQHPDPVDQSVAEINLGFNHLQIDAKTDSNSPETDDDDDDEDEEFTFMSVVDNDSPTTDEVFENGQIRPVFPLFDQSLLLGGDYDDGKRRLPIHVPVDNVFIQSPPPRDEKTDGVSAGTFCALPKESGTGTPEINMKSNSTGFSKLWRFRDNMNRSNSDGRDAFVFFQTPARSTTSSQSEGKVNAVDGTVKVNGAGGGKSNEKVVKKGLKVKKATASAHEVYLKQKGGKTEVERRRSYLPYRPGLMGFFTNVNGGLSKNVHPF